MRATLPGINRGPETFVGQSLLQAAAISRFLSRLRAEKSLTIQGVSQAAKEVEHSREKAPKSSKATRFQLAVGSGIVKAATFNAPIHRSLEEAAAAFLAFYQDTRLAPIASYF